MTIWRPSIAAGTTAQQSTSGRVATIIPPECCERWRGSPWDSSASRTSHSQRPIFSRPPPSARCTSSSTLKAAKPSDARATRSISPGGSPSALPISRIAPLARKVGNAATSAEWSGPNCWWIRGMSSARMSRGKSRSMSGSAVISSLRKRPRNSAFSIGSMCERPVR